MPPSEAGREETLRSAAIDSVTGAITRGRKRRLKQSQAPSSTPIQIGPTTHVKPENLANPARQPPAVSQHKRRKISLIGGEEEEDDDSNDEWEEHVEMDVEKVEAVVATRKREAEEEKAKAGKEELEIDKEWDNEKQGEEIKSEDEEKAERRRKRRERRKAAAMRKIVLRRHSIHLLLSIAHLIRLDSGASNDELQSLALSLVPPDTLLDLDSFNESLRKWALWSQSSFQVTAMIQVPFSNDDDEQKPTGTAWSVTELAIKAVRRSEGDITHLTTAAAALIRAQGFRCRIVSALHPLSHQMGKQTTSSQKRSMTVTILDGGKESNCTPVMYSWLEVWSPESQRWMPVDIFSGFVCTEDPASVIRESMSCIESSTAALSVTERKTSSTRGKKQKEKEAKPVQRRRSSRRLRKTLTKLEPVEEPVIDEKPIVENKLPPRKLRPSLFSHVVAVERGFVTDVTRRYITAWKEVEKARAKGRVFDKLVELFWDEEDEMANDDVRRLENEEFQTMIIAEALPTSVSAFHQHPNFILERHLKKYEIIHPRDPVVGYFKEEPVFLRANVRVLHTRDLWIRMMRQVMNNAKPLKKVRSLNGRDDTVDLFGEWQTEELIIPECVDGKVPRSVHGNVDLWTEDHLPKGSTHVNVPYAKQAASKLRVDFAMAMTGFEIRRGRSVPRLEGVVVASENADIVRDAARDCAKAARERLIKRAQKEAKERKERAEREERARKEAARRYAQSVADPSEGESAPKTAKGKKKGRKTKKAQETCGVGDKREHKFGKAKHVEGDTWVKVCVICNLEVTFEKL